VRTDLLRVSLSIGILAATAAVACSNSSSGGPVTANTDSGAPNTDSGAPAETGSSCQSIALTPNASGYVGPIVSVNIAGSWFVYGDGMGANGETATGSCETDTNMWPASSCSSITFPTIPTDGGTASFPQSTPGTMCLSGTAAQIIGTPPDYSGIYGIGLGLDFNNTTGTAAPYNATMNNVSALTFTVSGFPTGGTVRAEFQEAATNVAPEDAWAYPITGDGDVMVNLVSGSGAGELQVSFPVPTGDTEPPFDPTMILAIQFHVVPNTTAPTPVSNFCISNLAAVVCQ
jgi:hypothetical protein